MKISIPYGGSHNSLVRGGPGANPRNSVAELIRRVTSKMGTYRSADVPVSREEASALTGGRALPESGKADRKQR